MKMKRSLLIFMSAIFLLAGCDRKFNTEELVAPNTGGGNIGGDTVYVQLNPVWGGFNNPQDVYIGHDQFIYVADTDNDRVVMMNVAGQVLGSISIKKPVAISQDFRLNLIVCGETDITDTLTNQVVTYSAVYKIDLFAVGHQISQAVPVRILPRTSDLSKPLRKYTGVTTFYNNMYYIARKGPDNSSLFDPDNSILIGLPKSSYGGGQGDTIIGRVPNIDPVSSGLVTANEISALASFNKRNINLVVTLTGSTNFKAQQWNYYVSPIEEKYVSRFSPSDSVDFSRPNRFAQPEGCTIDPSGNIFVVDAVKDSVFKFNAFGNELESFGGAEVFDQPHGVAFFDRTLYVADSGNNRILRFILSTDIR
jgi:hypothetical protein